MQFTSPPHLPKRWTGGQKRACLSLIFVGAVTVLGACRDDNQAGNRSKSHSQRVVVNPQDSSPVGDDRDLTEAQNERRNNFEVTATVRVEKLLPDDREGLQHQRFLIALSNGTTVLVANDLHYGERVPISEGDLIRLRGEYVWNERGGVMHWTHRSDEPRHEGGWIELNGHRYQ